MKAVPLHNYSHECSCKEQAKGVFEPKRKLILTACSMHLDFGDVMEEIG
jgi:hypothetical protein